jgi:ubiquinone/menaquinone biosynthesis C-methylase UbiE
MSARARRASPGRATRGPDRRFFDLWSLFYDAPLVQLVTYRPVHDAVMRVLGRLSPRSVLDVGCGTGLLAARMRRQLGAVRVVGCDFSRGMLHRARARDVACGWVRGNALALPFRDGSFQALVSTEAFHWFPSQPDALREFFRVLAPGGYVLIALINPPFEGVSRAASAGSRLIGQPATWPTRGRMRRQVEQAGFRVESQRRVLRIPFALALPTVLTVAVRPR